MLSGVALRNNRRPFKISSRTAKQWTTVSAINGGKGRRMPEVAEKGLNLAQKLTVYCCDHQTQDGY